MFRRKKHHPKSVVITGSGRGIGRDLAISFAKEGTKLLLIGRNLEALAETGELCQQLGADCEIQAIDVRDQHVMEEALFRFNRVSAVDLVIANAGVSNGLGVDRSKEDEDAVRALLDINVQGVVNTVSPLLEQMKQRGRGQIALVSSLAGIRALPDMPSYSASKAAIAAYGIALRGWLKPFGVDVCVIYPGFVTSDMTARHSGLKPFEISSERAAAIISRGLARRRPSIAFPKALTVSLWLQNFFLPATLSDLTMRPFQAVVSDDLRLVKCIGNKEPA
ncbi:SDR family NAD(P)-dependent oxidoreductase [Rhodobacteraceae bacterium RKSG542]|uniref:SDR family NAD(P)-dependent oxidoreductase n=1 Tax=Pseudovibrio flavus TaxID=2529854 RepID=UPI0012BCCFAD|nr:SDR family NAD(P)-dependent oxidoreductase [Pseudovibrio flavus]MTI16950.1 SDR family NAD(P)-dependent oxidoreductase [Pseudovibrio flavus]